MKMFIAGLLCLLVLLFYGYSHEKWINKISTEKDRETADLLYQALKEKNWDYIESISSDSVLRDDFRAQLDEISLLIPAQEFIRREIVGAQRYEMGTVSNIALNIEYEFEGDFLLMNVAFYDDGSSHKLMGLNVQALKMSLREANRLTLSGKSLLHYIVLFGFFVFPIFTVVSFISCWKMKTLKKRKLWLLFIVIGIGMLKINWTTGQFAYGFLSVQLLSASFMKSGAASSWIFGVSIPIGAILFWMLKDQLIHKDVYKK